MEKDGEKKKTKRKERGRKGEEHMERKKEGKMGGKVKQRKEKMQLSKEATGRGEWGGRICTF